MANLTSVKIKDSYQSVLTTSETTSDPTTGTLQNGKGTAITTITIPTVVGNLTGNASTATSATTAGTVTGATQSAITGLGDIGFLTITNGENMGGVRRTHALSLGGGASFNIDLVPLFPGALFSGNFRYVRMTCAYYMAGRATREDWILAATNTGIVSSPTLLGRASAGAAITGTPVLNSGDSTLSIDVTTDATLLACSIAFELIIA